ncbi:MAG: TonB family protein [Gemmatimonadaceae bacterium]|nr:TonB family protein [Gemmatimonadaceae bacterium]
MRRYSFPGRALACLTFVTASCAPVYPDTYPPPADTALVSRPTSASTRGVVLASGDTAYWDYQVTRGATPLASIVPEYSEGTRARGAEGKVVARFAVNETGVPIMSTFTIVESPDYVLSESVMKAVAAARFQPAELNGRPVAQVVEMPFNFSIRK